MKVNERPYRVILMDPHVWRFEESDEMKAATQEFDQILGRHQGRAFATALRRFIRAHPNHIDALHHYASCVSAMGKPIDAYAFQQTAVAIGLRALPREFEEGRDLLDTGFVSNRPFLRALQGLMLAQRNVGLVEEAIATGELCLRLDPGDRMGARLSLPIYLLEAGRDRCALELFERKGLAESFMCVEYLRALALLCLGRGDEARGVLRSCLNYYPQIARYILDAKLPQPPNDATMGYVTSGSEYEGWINSQDFGFLWRKNPSAMEVLCTEAKPIAARNWERPKLII
jgi:tetratricopeptide (TPR) repeat protein